MTSPPHFNIDLPAFWQDPYPALAQMRAQAPIAYVPQLDAVLLTKRDTIFREEKRVHVFSSEQPGGLMTVLMGENMMRKDGEAHSRERRAIFPAVSPRTVRDVWKAQFEEAAHDILGALRGRDQIDLMAEYAMQISAEALKAITGLTAMPASEMDRVSQGMIDGVGNYAGDPAIEAACHDCTASIDAHIAAAWDRAVREPDLALLSVMIQAGLPEDQIRANIKLAISGGQNEPRDAISGAVAALLMHPDQLALVRAGRANWMHVFEEYARWMSPIGMSPRRIAQADVVEGLSLQEGMRAFLMFGSANRDEDVFEDPDRFDVTRDTSKAMSFGAGPHFCAGAWASKCLIADVALPMLFEAFPNIALAGDVRFGGWAFRGPLNVPVRLGAQ